MWKSVLGVAALVATVTATNVQAAPVGAVPSPSAGFCNDGNLATFDSLDFATGCINAPVPVDDGDPNTIDFVDATTGIISHFNPITNETTTEESISLLVNQRRETIPELGNQTSALSSALQVEYNFDAPNLELYVDLNPTSTFIDFSTVFGFGDAADFVLTSSDSVVSAASLASVGISSVGVFDGIFMAIDRDVGNAAIFGNFTLTVTEAVAPVPVPAALPLLATAIAGFGLVGWRKRRVS